MSRRIDAGGMTRQRKNLNWKQDNKDSICQFTVNGEKKHSSNLLKGVSKHDKDLLTRFIDLVYNDTIDYTEEDFLDYWNVIKQEKHTELLVKSAEDIYLGFQKVVTSKRETSPKAHGVERHMAPGKDFIVNRANSSRGTSTFSYLEPEDYIWWDSFLREKNDDIRGYYDIMVEEIKNEIKKGQYVSHTTIFNIDFHGTKMMCKLTATPQNTKEEYTIDVYKIRIKADIILLNNQVLVNAVNRPSSVSYATPEDVFTKRKQLESHTGMSSPIFLFSNNGECMGTIGNPKLLEWVTKY